MLTGFELIAQATKIPKKAIPTLVTVIGWYERLLQVGIPVQAWRAASRIAERHQATGLVRGGLPGVFSE